MRERGRPKNTWIEVLDSDMKMTEVKWENTKDWNKLKMRTRMANFQIVGSVVEVQEEIFLCRCTIG